MVGVGRFIYTGGSRRLRQEFGDQELDKEHEIHLDRHHSLQFADFGIPRDPEVEPDVFAVFDFIGPCVPTERQLATDSVLERHKLAEARQV